MTHPKRFCGCCGHTFDQHGSADNPHGAFVCPASAKFPPMPQGMRKARTPEAEAKAGAVWDARIAKHWTARGTAFRPA